jgi:hypothetical protein
MNDEHHTMNDEHHTMNKKQKINYFDTKTPVDKCDISLKFSKRQDEYDKMQIEYDNAQNEFTRRQACRCCTMHQKMRPPRFAAWNYQQQKEKNDEKDKKDEDEEKTCLCNCRHRMRRLVYKYF